MVINFRMNLLVILLSLTVGLGCTKTPEPEELPDIDDTIQQPDQEEPKPDPVPISKVVKFTDLLDEMLSYDGMTRYPDLGYESRQESSRDRRSVDPNDQYWFANDDGWGYERYEFPSGRTEKVIFDEQHPGVITRMWFTSFQSPQTVVRFYFDGSEEPSWEMSTFNLKEFGAYAGVTLGDGLAQPSSAWIRGSSLYLPIPYSKSCKITIEELVESTSASRYYHINYRRYADDVQVQTLTPNLVKSNLTKIKTLSAKLLSPSPDAGESTVSSGVILSGGKIEVKLPDGAKSLNTLNVSVNTEKYSDLVAALEGVIVEGIFDGTKTVSLPLIYLAGTGRGGFYSKTWRFESDGKGGFKIRWKMPWQNSASLIFHNVSPHQITLDVTAMVGDYRWDENSLYFHAFHKSEENYPIRYWSDYTNGLEWTFASIVGGKGVYMGDVYSIDNNTTEWPGEGDEKIWVDDEAFPSHFGTGVEDYFSFCGYFRFHTPFSGEPRLDSNNFKGINVHYRTRNLDAIPFTSKLKFTLEMQGHAVGTANLDNAVFWYGVASTRANGVVEYNL